MTTDSLLGPMPDYWHVSTLGEVAARSGGDIQTGPFGSQLHAADYVDDGIPSIMPKNIGDNRVDVEGIARITETDAKRLARYRVRRGDIVYSRRGDVEKRALIRDDEVGWLCGTGCLRVRFDDDTISPEYVSYYLGHPAVREWIVRHAHGATMPNLNTSILSALPQVVPPLAEQRAIAHILGTLDDKIELNRQMNATLDEIARTLFTSWFVTFDPVRAKAEGRQPDGMDADTAALFPDRLVDSELGPIPEGWDTKAMGELADLTIGGDWGQDQEFEESVAVVSLRGVDLGRLRYAGYSDAPRRWIKSASLERRKIDSRDILIAGSGAGPTGRPLWVSPNLESAFDLPLTYSNFCKRLRCKSTADAIYLDRYLLEMRESGEIWEYVNGTSIPNLNAHGLLGSKRLVVPPYAVMEKYAEVIKPITTKLYSGESRTLAELRDTLLPELLSGRLSALHVPRV